MAGYSIYPFRGINGYLHAPRIKGSAEKPVAIRHSAGADPRRDDDIRLHESSEEYYLLQQGRLWILVQDQAFR